MMYISVSELSQHWSMWCYDALSPVWRQGVTWSDVELMSIAPSATNACEIEIKLLWFLFQKNAFENVVSKMSTIWFQLQ